MSTILGKWGEEISAQYLRKKRYEIIAANFHTRFGEVDLIATKKNTIVFVEVKLRKNDLYGEAGEFVTFAKQRKVITSAEIWLQNNPTNLQPRFDVIEIYAPNGVGGKYSLKHIKNAFHR